MNQILTLKALLGYYIQLLLQAELKWSDYIDQGGIDACSPALEELLFRSAGLSKNHLRLLGRLLEELEEGQSIEEGRIVQQVFDEMRELLRRIPDPAVNDAAVIVALQCFCHYKVALYAAVASFAQSLQLPAIAQTLQHLLDEERAGDRGMAVLAESQINPAASQHLAPGVQANKTQR